MRCCSCLRNIAAGVEAAKMIVVYQQGDAAEKIHGYMMSDGPLSVAAGQMVRGYHFKCFHVARKRAAKGDAVTGRVLAGTPTGYDIDALVLTRDDLSALGITAAQARERSTIALSERLRRLRELAQGLGRGVGDATVVEAFRADEHGGPYQHDHHHRLETYQLVAHLEYAHGVRDIKLLRPAASLQDQHAEWHARASLEQIQAARLADGTGEQPHTDWRTQYTAEISNEETHRGPQSIAPRHRDHA